MNSVAVGLSLMSFEPGYCEGASAVSAGTCSVTLRHPPLKRWAILGRPYGTSKRLPRQFEHKNQMGQAGLNEQPETHRKNF
jgi:hypothetical protein